MPDKDKTKELAKKQARQIKDQLMLFLDLYEIATELKAELPGDLWEPMNRIIRYRKKERLAGRDEILIRKGMAPW